MGVKKGTNNFATHQTEKVDAHLSLIEAELKDVRSRAGVKFEDIDSLVRYVAKVTGLHRTTLKRNTSYRRLLRDFLAREAGSTAVVKMDDATPELLRAMVEDRDLTIGNLQNQLRVLKVRMDAMEAASKATKTIAAPVATEMTPERQRVDSGPAFQDTAFALMQLIEHLNKTAGSEIVVIDTDAGLILDAAIPNPRKRREMAIGPERTKAFMAWVKAQKVNSN
jgi:hypothetical protein